MQATPEPPPRPPAKAGAQADDEEETVVDEKAMLQAQLQELREVVMRSAREAGEQALRTAGAMDALNGVVKSGRFKLKRGKK